MLPEHWQQLALYRLIATAVLVALAWPREVVPTTLVATAMLSVLLAATPVLYLAVLPIMNEIPDQGLAGVLRSFYSYLPYTVMAGLSVFFSSPSSTRPATTC